MEEEEGSNRDVQRPDLGASRQGQTSNEASWTSMESSLELISSNEVLTSSVEHQQTSILSPKDGDGELGVSLPLMAEDVAEVALDVRLPAVADVGDLLEAAIGDQLGSVGLGRPVAASQLLNGGAASEHGDGFMESVDVLCLLPVRVFSSVPVRSPDLVGSPFPVSSPCLMSSPVLDSVCSLHVFGGLGDDEDCHVIPDVVNSSPAHVPMLVVNECCAGGGLVTVDGSLLRVAVGGSMREEDVVPLAARAALRPQPTDGRRHLSLPSVEPAEVIRSNPGVGHGVLSASGQPRCSAADPGFRSFASRAAVQPQQQPTGSSSQRVGVGCSPKRRSPMIDDQGWQQSQSRRGWTSVGSSRGQHVEELERVDSGISNGAHLSSVGPAAQIRETAVPADNQVVSVRETHGIAPVAEPVSLNRKQARGFPAEKNLEYGPP
ncbi:hypothetical protein Dimus_035603 [Dionaea muscipula]